jgi:transcriptional regulator with XRE-family HTH domain
VSLTGARLGEYEKWPGSACKPPVGVLVMLARVYQTDVLCLLDLADHESLPRQDRLVLLRRPRAATPFGERVVALMQERGLSAAGTARRVSCSPGYLSNVIHGRKRPSRRVAARLDDLLQAGGDLIALAGTAEIVTDDGEPPRGTAPGPADDGQGALAGQSALFTYDVDAHTVTGGQLTLVPRTGDTGTDETEMTSA